MADICHTCRRCYNLCPSFDVLFRALDRPEVDGEVGPAPGTGPRRVLGPLLRVQALHPALPVLPAAPLGGGHSAVVLRDRAARVKSDGKLAPARARSSPRPTPSGALATTAAPLVNAAQRDALARGPHGEDARRAPGPAAAGVRRRDVPRSGGSGAAARRSPPTGRRRRDRVALFVTCSVNANNPEIGRAAVGRAREERLRGRRAGAALLRHAVPRERRRRLRARVPLGQRRRRCCRSSRAGYAIVAPGPDLQPDAQEGVPGPRPRGGGEGGRRRAPSTSAST